ncbi:MAG TPA: mechanosensitive ion channel family protein [Tepidisphaeraceae bacterium]|nr:mechanosensitive ion channel family protein [Tepidisphaeraceae bacterium]
MLSSSLLSVVMFIGAYAHAATAAKEPAPAPGEQQSAAVASAAPSTQPAPAGVVTAASGANVESLSSILGKTRFGQLVEGKKQVTLAEVKDPLFWLDTIRDLAVAALGFIPRVIVAGLFLIFFWLVYRTVRRLVLGSLSAASVDPSIRDMLGHMLKWAIMGFGVVIACNQIGVQIAALLTGVSIIGLAVGFAAQETLANFIAGIVIFWDKPFKVGDFVEIDGVFGEVKRVTFRSTRILDGNGQFFVFPNTTMLATKLSNHSTHPATKVKLEIGIAYKESIDAARNVLLELVKGDDRIAAEPEPSVGVARCAASSVDLSLSFWVHDETVARGMPGEYLEKAKNALDAAGITIPFPHVQLLVDKGPQEMTISPEEEPQPMRRAG